VIEPGGYFDLLRLLPGRQGDPEQLLDELILIPRRIEEVEPHRAGGLGWSRMRRRFQIGGRKAIIVSPIDAQHGASPPVAAAGQP
jgi:hypothetical protein